MTKRILIVTILLSLSLSTAEAQLLRRQVRPQPATPREATPTATPTSRTPFQFTPTATEQREIDAFMAKNSGRDIRWKNVEGWTLLHIAAAEGKVAVVKHLMSQGANVNTKCKSGWIPLHHAADFGHLEIAQLLVSAGSDVNARDGQGKTPLDWARVNNRTAVVQYLQSVSRGGAQASASRPAQSSSSQSQSMAAIDEILKHRIATGGQAPASRVKEYQEAADAVLANDRASWQQLKGQNNYASDFVSAGDQCIRSNGSLSNLRRFARVQAQYTGNVWDID